MHALKGTLLCLFNITEKPGKNFARYFTLASYSQSHFFTFCSLILKSITYSSLFTCDKEQNSQLTYEQHYTKNGHLWTDFRESNKRRGEG